MNEPIMSDSAEAEGGQNVVDNPEPAAENAESTSHDMTTMASDTRTSIAGSANVTKRVSQLSTVDKVAESGDVIIDIGQTDAELEQPFSATIPISNELKDKLSTSRKASRISKVQDVMEQTFNSPNFQLKCCLVVLGLVLQVVAIVMIYATLIDLNTYGVCLNITRGIPVASNPVLANLCELGDCTFDAGSVCDVECPVGHEVLIDSGSPECPHTCVCRTSGLYQSDISFSDTDTDVKILYSESGSDSNYTIFDMLYGRSDIINMHRTWKTAEDSHVIPYVITKQAPNEIGFDNNEQNAIRSAILQFTPKSCVGFKEVIEADIVEGMDYIVFNVKSYCSAPVGRHPGENVIGLNSYCLRPEGIHHLLMHVLGFHHEQARPDRDAHVSIVPSNILASAYNYAFNKINKEYAFDLGVEYNTKSIMHFPYNAFSQSPTHATIEGITGEVLGKGENDLIQGMQSSDVKALNVLYECPGYDKEIENLKGSWSEWAGWVKDVQTNEGNCSRYRRCETPAGRLTVGCRRRSSENQFIDAEIRGSCPGAATPVSGRRFHGKARLDAAGRQDMVVYLNDVFNGPVGVDNRMCRYGEMFVAKLNFDHRSDIICYYYEGYYVTYVNAASGNDGWDEVGQQGVVDICAHTKPSKRILLAGDIDGDSFTDLLCIKQDGEIEVSLWKGHYAKAISWRTKHSAECAPGNNKAAHLADINADAKADLMCGERGKNEIEEVFYAM